MYVNEIESELKELPLYQYAFIKTTDIPFSEKVRTICETECPRYHTSWSCPPAVGTVHECKNRCLQYENALFFSTVSQVKDSMDMKETLSKRREHERIVENIEKLFYQKYASVYTLSSESCAICESCTWPEQACRNPQKMHPCIESHGILIASLAENNAFDYFIDNQIVLWFGILFFR